MLLLMASGAMAQEPDSSSALYQMREAERNFARASVMLGRNAAFVEYFAEESILFTDTWITRGKQFLKDKKPPAIVLKWEPEFMDISASHNFGISTGPWEMQEYRPFTTPLATGYFLTVWKKQASGVWQVILDAGSETPAPTAHDHAFSFPAGADKTIPPPVNFDVKSVSNELVEREKQFLLAWKNSPVTSTYASFLAPKARLQLNRHLPATNADTINVRIAHLDKALTWKLAGSGIAASGDLGFTYGFLEIPDNPKRTIGHYVRIWRKQPDGKWNIEIEMMNMN